MTNKVPLTKEELRVKLTSSLRNEMTALIDKFADYLVWNKRVSPTLPTE